MSDGGAVMHRLTPTPWIGRREEAADGLHSVQETMAALMCQTNKRREEMGGGCRCRSEGSPLLSVRGASVFQSPEKPGPAPIS